MKWQNDAHAWKFLEDQGYEEERFVIQAHKHEEPATELECSAIEYLVYEWDWGCKWVKENSSGRSVPS